MIKLRKFLKKVLKVAADKPVGKILVFALVFILIEKFSKIYKILKTLSKNYDTKKFFI